jgi:hypothetical protein
MNDYVYTSKIFIITETNPGGLEMTHGRKTFELLTRAFFLCSILCWHCPLSQFLLPRSRVTQHVPNVQLPIDGEDIMSVRLLSRFPSLEKSKV